MYVCEIDQSRTFFLQHIVFVITGIMQFMIPDIPAEVKTQMQREQLLAKEAKFQNGVKENQHDHDMMALLKTQEAEDPPADVGLQTLSGNSAIRGSWTRRFSRLTDTLDAQVNINSRKIKSDESMAWDGS